jgi:hypothetical protein
VLGTGRTTWCTPIWFSIRACGPVMALAHKFGIPKLRQGPEGKGREFVWMVKKATTGTIVPALVPRADPHLPCGPGVGFGNRIMLLHHIGRVSSQPRQAILEVVGDIFTPASWGSQSMGRKPTSGRSGDTCRSSGSSHVLSAGVYQRCLSLYKPRTSRRFPIRPPIAPTPERRELAPKVERSRRTQ